VLNVDVWVVSGIAPGYQSNKSLLPILGLGRIGTLGIHLGEHAVQGGNLGISLRQFQSFQWFQLFQTVGNIANDFRVGAPAISPETMQRAVIHIRATPRFRNSENVKMNGHRAMRLAES
jgi:hypothetical protein